MSINSSRTRIIIKDLFETRGNLIESIVLTALFVCRYGQMAKTENTIGLYVHTLKPGVYFIQWKDDAGVHREKFIKR